MFYKQIIIIILMVVIGWPPYQFALGANSTGQAPFFVVAEYNVPSIIINELMWMGSSLSSYDEWLELKNTTNQPVDISDWYLSRKSSGEEKLMLIVPSETVIEPQGLFVIANYDSLSANSSLVDTPDLVDSAVSLANNQLHIKLYDGTGKLIDVADDGSGKPLAGEYSSGEAWGSMERNALITTGTQNEAWHSSIDSLGFKTTNEKGTPGAVNSNSAPIIEIGDNITTVVGDIVSFDASDSLDPDGDALIFSWDFGDGDQGTGATPTHIYQTTGTFAVVLEITDNSIVVTDTMSVIVEPRSGTLFTEPGVIVDRPLVTDIKPAEQADVRLSELLPNPAGLDKEGEFIELYNAEAAPVNLLGWQLVVGTKTFEFPAIAIAADDYIALGYQTTKATLKNAGGIVELLNPKGVMVDSVAYEAGGEQQSWARFVDGWQWTDEPTFGEENVLRSLGAVLGADLSITTSPATTVAEYLSISLAEVQTLETRTKVRAEGVVTVLPEQFSAQYFYIFDGSAGTKIYSSKKSFPNIDMGDKITVQGSIGESEGERKINVLTENGIQVIDKNVSLEPLLLLASEINEAIIGSLVTVEGEAKEAKTSSFVLADDNSELLISIKRNTGIGKPAVSEGDAVTVTGIVSLKNGDYTLLPRTAEDISSAGVVAGDLETEEINLTTTDDNSSVRTTLWIGLIFALLLAGAVWWKYVYKKRAQPAN